MARSNSQTSVRGSQTQEETMEASSQGFSESLGKSGAVLNLCGKGLETYKNINQRSIKWILQVYSFFPQHTCMFLTVQKDSQTREEDFGDFLMRDDFEAPPKTPQREKETSGMCLNC